MTEQLSAFYRDVSGCTVCFGSKETIAVPTPQRFPERVKVLILGEQPTAKDGDDGALLAGFLKKARIDKATTFHATAVLCNPTNKELRPGRPTPTEARNCAAHIRRMLGLLRPTVMVPLGHTSIQSLQAVFEDWPELRRYILNYDIGTVVQRKGVAVYPLYHPSATTLKARSRSRQLRDWQRIPQLLEKLGRAAAAS